LAAWSPGLNALAHEKDPAVNGRASGSTGVLRSLHGLHLLHEPLCGLLHGSTWVCSQKAPSLSLNTQHPRFSRRACSHLSSEVGVSHTQQCWHVVRSRGKEHLGQAVLPRSTSHTHTLTHSHTHTQQCRHVVRSSGEEHLGQAVQPRGRHAWSSKLAGLCKHHVIRAPPVPCPPILQESEQQQAGPECAIAWPGPARGGSRGGSSGPGRGAGVI